MCTHTHRDTHGLMWWWFVLFPTFTILCGLRVQEQTENTVYFVLHCRRLINPTGITRVLKNKGLMCNNPERRWKKKKQTEILETKTWSKHSTAVWEHSETRHKNGNRSTVTGVWAEHDNGGWERSFQVVA